MFGKKTLLGLVLAILTGAALAEPPAKEVDPARLKLSDKATIAASLAQLAPLLEGSARVKGDASDWRSAQEKPKGIGLAVYPKVAPAVVVVRNADSMGTGFFVHSDGWIITNHHVVRDARPDPKTGARRVMIHVGRLNDGQMQVVEQGIPALVYKVNAVQDLALLRLVGKPKEGGGWPALRLSEQKLVPGIECAAIGHPAAGTLWTLRSGEIAGIADWPGERSEIMVKVLGLPPGAERDKTKAMLGNLKSRKILLSTCGLNPGDSGGPLVNKDGEVIAVSFAIPANDPGSGVNLEKVSYHVHRDELKAFLADRERLAAVPGPYVPSVEPDALYCQLLDLEENGKSQAVLFGRPDEKKGKVPTGLWLDLRNSNANFSEKDLTSEEKRRQWKFQFALHREPYPTAFYDTDGDGKIDLILQDTDGDGKADVALRLVEGKWVVEDAKGGKLIDPRLFKDEMLEARFRRYARSLEVTLLKP